MHVTMAAREILRFRSRFGSVSVSTTRRCSSLPTTRSESRTTTRRRPGTSCRWTLNGPRTLTTGSSMSFRLGPRPWPHAERRRGSKAIPSKGRLVTVSCAEGDVGRVYDGQLPFETTRIEMSDVKRPHIAIMLNLGNPELAFRTAMLPNDGVGLARMEFIVSEHIGVHPMALVNPEKVTSTRAQKAIRRLVRNYARPADYFVEKLSEGVGVIAAAFYPKPVIVRLSDFKTNEYASLIGGD